MKLLPVYDYKHHRAEKVAFLTLQIAALALVGFAVADASRFSVRREQICQALSSNLLATASSAAKTTVKLPTGLPVKTGQQTAGAPHLTPPRS